MMWCATMCCIYFFLQIAALKKIYTKEKQTTMYYFSYPERDSKFIVRSSSIKTTKAYQYCCKENLYFHLPHFLHWWDCDGGASVCYFHLCFLNEQKNDNLSWQIFWHENYMQKIQNFILYIVQHLYSASPFSPL